MKVIFNTIIPFKGFKAINLFGILFAREGASITPTTLRHEYIHTLQQREMLWLFFYLWYFIEWIIRYLFSKDRFSRSAYRNISFEREAYLYQTDDTYTLTRNHFSWFKYL